MNIRQLGYYSRNKKSQKYIVKSKPGILEWLNGSFNLSEQQRLFLQAESKYVLGLMPRREGKTFIQLLDALYGISQNKDKVEFICPTLSHTNSAKSLAYELSNKLNVNINITNIIFTTNKENNLTTKGLLLNKIYIDEYCLFQENIENKIISQLTKNPECKLKGCSTPGPMYFRWIKHISESPLCINVGDYYE